MKEIWNHERNLNPRPLNSIRMLQPTELWGHEFDLHFDPKFCSYSNFIFCSILCLVSVPTFVLVEWTDTYIIHHRSILRRSNGKSAWVRFEPIITEFCLESHDHWIPSRCSNQLSYQVMSSTRTLRQLPQTLLESLLEIPAMKGKKVKYIG